MQAISRWTPSTDCRKANWFYPAGSVECNSRQLMSPSDKKPTADLFLLPLWTSMAVRLLLRAASRRWVFVIGQRDYSPFPWGYGNDSRKDPPKKHSLIPARAAFSKKKTRVFFL